MIDFIKLNISYMDTETLLSNAKIKWSHRFDSKTGEVFDYPILGEYYNLKLKINPIRIELSGSLHIYSNLLREDKRHNYDDFNLKDLTKIIFRLKSDLSIDPKKTTIENLEFGVNISTWKDPSETLSCNVIAWNCVPPNKNYVYRKGSKFLEWRKSQQKLKLYDKGKQYKQVNYIMRIEKGVLKNEYLKRKYEISKLHDLINTDCINKLRDDLINSLKGVLIVDNLSPEIECKKDNLEFSRFTNPKFWETTKNRTTRHRHKKKVDHLLEKYDLNRTKENLVELVSKKSNDLIRCNDLTNILKPENETNLPVYKLSKDKPQPKCLSELIPVQIQQTKKYAKRPKDKISKSDQYEVKKERNNKSNLPHHLIRQLKKRIDYLDKYGYSHLTNQITLTEEESKLITRLLHLPQWKKYIDRVI